MCFCILLVLLTTSLTLYSWIFLFQVEISPYFQQEKLVKFCQERGLVVTAFSSFGSPGRPWLDINFYLYIMNCCKKPLKEIICIFSPLAVVLCLLQQLFKRFKLKG